VADIWAEGRGEIVRPIARHLEPLSRQVEMFSRILRLKVVESDWPGRDDSSIKKLLRRAIEEW
jgi:hypothetical protein